MKKYKYLIFIPLFIYFNHSLFASSDWPIYKGNIYFTGNNDEITVKNPNLKWLFQAANTVYNPIVSDRKIYFTDLEKNLYCLDEDTGKLLWKIDLRALSSQFKSYSAAFGKVKYPLIKGNSLFITDNIAIYCIDKNSGRAIWARTGMRDEKNIDTVKDMKIEGSGKWRPGMKEKWQPGKSTYGTVDSIYSDPVIYFDKIYYGTRNDFISRDISNGHMQWENTAIKSWSGFPSFYDEYIFTQSMDYQSNVFSINCLNAQSGKIIWSRSLDKPMQIFSPVIYNGKVYLANSKKLFCFDIANGSPLWDREYADYITSNPSFTEREILFTVGNRSFVSVNPADGSVVKTQDFGEKSSPYFVVIRDQLYIANTFKKEISGRDLPFASLKCLKFGSDLKLWEYMPQFPGGASQPVASGGIMFMPAGNYLYAIGTDYYPRIVNGGSALYDPYNRTDDGAASKKEVAPESAVKKPEIKPPDDSANEMKMRKMKITVADGTGSPVKADVEVKKWDKGKVVYSQRARITGPGQEIEVPDMDDVEITANSDGYLPNKAIVSRKDPDKKITLEKIEKGKGIVVDNIYFEIDEAYLKKESLNILDTIIDGLKRNKNVKLEVRGHTDSTGPRDHNMRLSGRRADAVVEYMVKNGISPERIKGKGFGPDKPIAANTTEDGRRKNRRTEFFVVEN